VEEASRTSGPGAFYTRDQNAALTHVVLQVRSAQDPWAAPTAPAEIAVDELLASTLFTCAMLEEPF
jgi:hypothetical protein